MESGEQRPPISRGKWVKSVSFGLGLVVGIALGFGGGYLYISSSSFDSGYAAGVRDSAEKLSASGLVPEEMPVITSLSGRIIEITENGFRMEADPITVNPLSADIPSVREIVIDGNTSLTRRIELTPEEFEEALRAFVETDLADDVGARLPPEPFTTEIAEDAELTEGLRVIVESDKDIYRAETVHALRIEIL